MAADATRVRACAAGFPAPWGDKPWLNETNARVCSVWHLNEDFCNTRHPLHGARKLIGRESHVLRLSKTRAP